MGIVLGNHVLLLESGELLRLLAIAGTMFTIGLVLGYIGAGGAGMILATLVLGFDVPMHMAVGVAATASGLGLVSSTLSHYRNGNVSVRLGFITGLFGAAVAAGAMWVAQAIAAPDLKRGAGFLLVALAVLIYWKTRIMIGGMKASEENVRWPQLALIGGVTGSLFGLFGISGSIVVQLGYTWIRAFALKRAIGTAALAVFLISLGAIASAIRVGAFDWKIAFSTTLGSVVGSYIGASFTQASRDQWVRYAVVAMSASVGIVLIFAG